MNSRHLLTNSFWQARNAYQVWKFKYIHNVKERNNAHHAYNDRYVKGYEKYQHGLTVRLSNYSMNGDRLIHILYPPL